MNSSFKDIFKISCVPKQNAPFSWIRVVCSKTKCVSVLHCNFYSQLGSYVLPHEVTFKNDYVVHTYSERKKDCQYFGHITQYVPEVPSKTEEHDVSIMAVSYC